MTTIWCTNIPPACKRHIARSVFFKHGLRKLLCKSDHIRLFLTTHTKNPSISALASWCLAYVDTWLTGTHQTGLALPANLPFTWETGRPCHLLVGSERGNNYTSKIQDVAPARVTAWMDACCHSSLPL
jgi:hypothetical protein